VTESKKMIWKNILSLLIIGFGIGWLAGMSVSPVASIVISALLGVAISIFGVTAIFLEFGKDSRGVPHKMGFSLTEAIDIGKFALVVFGIVAGVNIGIWMRVHETLGVKKQNDSFVNMQNDLNRLEIWFEKMDEKAGLEKKQIVQRILDKYYPKGGVVNKSKHGDPILFSQTANDTCRNLYSLSGKDLRQEVKTSGLLFEKIESYTQDDQELKTIIDNICGKENKNGE
jgi:hypothetical protein